MANWVGPLLAASAFEALKSIRINGMALDRRGPYCDISFGPYLDTTPLMATIFSKKVCLGFIENRDAKGVRQKVTNSYVTDGDYEIEIAGIRFPAKANIHSPILPSKHPDKERDAYQATRGKPNEDDGNQILRAV